MVCILYSTVHILQLMESRVILCPEYMESSLTVYNNGEHQLKKKKQYLYAKVQLVAIVSKVHCANQSTVCLTG